MGIDAVCIAHLNYDKKMTPSKDKIIGSRVRILLISKSQSIFNTKLHFSANKSENVFLKFEGIVQFNSRLSLLSLDIVILF